MVIDITGGEFERVWRLMVGLWPAAAAKKTENQKIIWREGLRIYSMASITERIMGYARREKFFPDLCDITGNLIADDDPADREKMEINRRMVEKMRTKEEARV